MPLKRPIVSIISDGDHQCSFCSSSTLTSFKFTIPPKEFAVITTHGREQLITPVDIHICPQCADVLHDGLEDVKSLTMCKMCNDIYPILTISKARETRVVLNAIHECYHVPISELVGGSKR